MARRCALIFLCFLRHVFSCGLLKVELADFQRVYDVNAGR